MAPATGGFAVNATATPDTNINISTGVAYVTGTPTSQNSQTMRVKCTVTGTLAISANASGSTKYDWIYIKLDATKMANPAVGADDVATIVASRSTSASTDDGTPPTYNYPIAVVTVANGFSTITNGNIRDIRTNPIVNLGSSSASSGWIDLGYNPNTVTALGNRSYSCVFNSTDLTSTLSKGMKLKLTRLITAPTQSTDLNGSSQYWSKTSPAGTTFTDDFVVSAWINIDSYKAQSIVSRYNGTSGWDFQLNAAGQVILIGYNAGAANFSQVASSQTVPLNKWVHVAAQLDMSAFDTGTKTNSYVMIDGVDVPAAVSRGGTNPTALVQAGNLEIGSRNGGTQFFDGRIAQAAYYSAKVTEATMLTYISQTLAGNETSNVSTFTFNGSGNDSNANANNLTAQASATATSANTPFAQGATGTTEYGIITAIAFSTNTTATVQVPEGSAIPTSGGVSAVAYSTQKTPYSFPSTEDKWQLLYFQGLASPASGTGSSYLQSTVGNISFVPPIGVWNMEGLLNVSLTSTDVNAALSTSTSSVSDADLNTRNFINSNVLKILDLIVKKTINQTAATTWYAILNPGGGTGAGFRGKTDDANTFTKIILNLRTGR